MRFRSQKFPALTIVLNKELRGHAGRDLSFSNGSGTLRNTIRGRGRAHRLFVKAHSTPHQIGLMGRRDIYMHLEALTRR